MMKKFFFVIYVLNIQLAKSQDFIAYYNQKYSAENALIIGDISSSNQIYSELLKENSFVFASDCFNAFQVSLLANDSINTAFCIRKCFEFGISLNILKQSPLLCSYVDSNKFDDVFNTYDSLSMIYSQKVNWPLRDRIVKIYEREQFYNEKFDHSNFLNFIPNRFIYKRENKKAIDSLINIINEIGYFPGEQEIGVVTFGMYVFDSLTEQFYQASKGRPYLNTHEYLIFAHYYQFGGKKDFDSILLKSVSAFQLKPRDFAFVSDFRKRKKKSDYYSLKGKALKFYNKKQSQEFIEIIDSNRLRIGLYSLESSIFYDERRDFQRSQYLLNNFKLIYLE